MGRFGVKCEPVSVMREPTGPEPGETEMDAPDPDANDAVGAISRQSNATIGRAMARPTRRACVATRAAGEVDANDS